MAIPWFKTETIPWEALTDSRSPTDRQALVYDLSKNSIVFGDAVGGGGGGGAFSGARAGFSANRLNQDYETARTVSWNRQVFDEGDWYDPAHPTRLTVPAGVTHVVVYGGMDFSDIGTGADICFDFNINGVSLGIGYSIKNAATDTFLWKATADTGVVAVTVGDYFEMSLDVQGDTDFTIDENGTYFSIASWPGGTAFDANALFGIIAGTPSQGDVIKYVSGTPGSFVWSQDLQGAGGGEANVQADWTQTSSAQDSFIQNKPIIPTIPVPTAVGDVLTATGTMAGQYEFSAPTGGGGGGTPVTANPSGTDGDDLTRIAIAGTNYVVAVPTSWSYRIGTTIVPSGTTLADAHITYHQSGGAYYLTFINWTQADLDKIDHIPIDGLIGLQQQSTWGGLTWANFTWGRTFVLNVRAVFDAVNRRYHVANVNGISLTEQASGTATDILLTEAPSSVVANPGGTGLTDLTSLGIDGVDYALAAMGGGGGGTPAVPEVLYEDTTSQSYAQDAWINLTGIRELVEADDNSIIEMAFRVVGQDLWEVFELSADLLRARPFNTSSNATSPGFRFKTGRSESNLSGFGHSMAFLSRRDATTWRVGQAHVWFDRIRIELLPDGGGGSGTKVVANPGGTGLVDLDTVSIDGVGYNIAGGGSAFNLAALYGVIGGTPAVGKVIKYVSSTAAAWADDAEGQVTTAKILSAIGGSPNQGDVVKFVAGTPGSLAFSADLQGGGGVADGVINTAAFDTTATAGQVAYSFGRTVGDALTGTFAVFDGTYASLTGKPAIGESIERVSNLPAPTAALNYQIYGQVVIPNMSNPASSLHYLRKAELGQFRARLDNASTAGTHTARGYADADNSPYYGATNSSAIYPDAARTAGVEAVVYSTATASGRAQWRVRTATTLAEGTSVTDFIWLAARVKGAQWSEVQLFWDTASSEWVSAEYAADPLSTALHGIYDVVLSTANGRVGALPIVTTNQMAQVTDGDSLGIKQAEIYTYLQAQINAVGGMATPSTVDIAAIITAMGGSPQAGQVIKYESVGPTLAWGDDIVGTGGGTTYTPTVTSLYPIIKQIVISVTGVGGVTFTPNDMGEYLTGAVTIPPFNLSSITDEANPNALASTDRLLIADASSMLENRYITVASPPPTTFR